MTQATTKRKGWKRVGRILLKTLLGIFLLIVVLFLLILTPPVQNFITGKATNYLEKKLNTKVEIGRLFFTLSGKVAIDDIYVEDLQKDTLLSAGKVRVSVSLRKILFGNELDIKSVELGDVVAKLRRQLPDTTFNFQFIVDAFSSPEETTPDTDTSSGGMAIRVGTVELNNIRFLYTDVVSGNDVDSRLGRFYTKVKNFDLEKLHFEVPNTTIDGLVARIVQTKPLQIPVVPENSSTEGDKDSPFLELEFGKIALTKSAVDYRDSVGGLFANLNLGELEVQPEKLDLSKTYFHLGKIKLHDTKGDIRMAGGKKTKAVVLKDTANATEGSSFALQFAELDLKNIALKYNDDEKPKQAKGMDYAHLDAVVNTLQAENFKLAGDTISGLIKEAALAEQSGFKLDELRADFFYGPHGATLKDLYIKTPGTEIQRDLAVSYPSLEALSANIGSLKIEADIPDSRIQVKDILVFVPTLQQQPLLANPNTTWYLDTKINGSVDDLTMEKLLLKGDGYTRVDVSGRIVGLPEVDNIAANLTIREVRTARKEVAQFLPAGTLPSTIELPNTVSLTGKIKGGIRRLETDLALKTDVGNATVKGALVRITDSVRAEYDVVANTQNLDLGVILKDKKTYGPVTASFTAKGRGYAVSSAAGNVSAIITSAFYNQYVYQGLKMDAVIEGQQVKATAELHDPNIDFSLTANADMSRTYPAFRLDAVIDSIKPHNLHFTADPIVYRGNINADFPVADPDTLQGQLFITKSLLVMKGEKIQMDTVKLVAGNEAGKKFLHFDSDIAHARLEGQFKLTTLPGVFSQVIQPYFASSDTSVKKTTEPYDFTLNAYVSDRPLLYSLVPGLEKMDGVNLNSRFSSTEGVDATLTANEIAMNGTSVTGLNVTAATADTALTVNAAFQRLKSGNSIQVDSTKLNATLANNNIDFDLNIQDGESKEKYGLAGKLAQLPGGAMSFALDPDGLVLNYDKWQLPPGNTILIAKDGINIRDFVLSKDGQQLSVQSASAANNAPMEVRFTDFQLSTLTGMVMADSMMVGGNLSGNVNLQNITTNLTFTGDLNIRDLSYHNDTVGNIQAKVNNTTPDKYAADVTLSGRGNDAVITGTYTASTSALDLILDLRRLPMKTAEAFAGGAIRNSTGQLTGKFQVTGQVSAPVITGDLSFDQVRMNVAMLNSYFSVDKEKISVTREGIRFDRFQVKDSSGNDLSIDGVAATTNFTNYKFDLTARANNFKALSSTKKDNQLFWGQLYFNTNINIKGTEQAPVIDGRLAINEKTKMTIVLPQNEPGVVDREGVVEFVDMDAPFNDSLFMASYDSFNTTAITGADINVNIEVDKQADLTLIVDEGNGDFLNVKGEATLNTTVSPGGDITLAGTYDLEEGAYELSFNGIRRRFDIQRGSKITWGGPPTEADVNITAKYIADAAPLDLVKGQLGEDITAVERNTYLQKLPFEVTLRMQGKLLKPVISFDIILPENKQYFVSNDIITNVRTKLDQIRQETGELNKQVFALLLLKRFVAENPFNSSGAGITANTLARQSVSKLMTEQLNRLASDLVKGVDLNFDVESSEDYTTGNREDRTDLNVGLSKRLLNDRLTVTVGSNFELEGPPNSTQQGSNIAGNIAVNYRLSKDGRYQLRAYRKNEFQGVIDGYIIETGVGFIITLDYNRFREIFQKKKIERERQRRREERRRRENADSTNTPTAQPS